MGYTTDFIGQLEIRPRLNEQEIEYLTAFTQSRRCLREGGPYAVPDNPLAESAAEFPGDTYNIPSHGQPQLWCDWEICWDGCCLAWSGKEKSYEMTRWLEYLIDHFLKPAGRASGHPGFEEFTFDHEVEGQLVGCRRDTKELFSISVRANRVQVEVLRKADPRFAGVPPLPYEAAKDRWAPTRRRRPRDNVVDLASRRTGSD